MMMPMFWKACRFGVLLTGLLTILCSCSKEDTPVDASTEKQEMHAYEFLPNRTYYLYDSVDRKLDADGNVIEESSEEIRLEYKHFAQVANRFGTIYAVQYQYSNIWPLEHVAFSTDSTDLRWLWHDIQLSQNRTTPEELISNTVQVMLLDPIELGHSWEMGIQYNDELVIEKDTIIEFNNKEYQAIIIGEKLAPGIYRYVLAKDLGLVKESAVYGYYDSTGLVRGLAELILKDAG